MENKELNKKIIEKVRNKIVISNLEREETMKISKRKQVLSIAAAIMIILTGSFISVNAATNGELAEAVKDTVKDTVKVILIKQDGKEVETKKSTYTDKNNHTIEKQELKNSNGSEFKIEADKTILDEQNMMIEGNITEKDGEEQVNLDIKPR